MARRFTAYATASGLAVLCAAAGLLGDTARESRSPGSSAVASLPPVTRDLAEWTSLLELVSQTRERSARCLSPLEADIARRHEMEAKRALKWLAGKGRDQLRLAFETFTAEHSKPTWDAVKRALLKYEIGLAYVVNESGSLGSPPRAQALQEVGADRPIPIGVRVEPAMYRGSDADLLSLIRRSELLVDDLNARIPSHTSLCELIVAGSHE